MCSSQTEIRMTVRDDGPGLPDAAVRRLLFSEPVQPGSGVGLRTVHDLVMGRGGQIDHKRSDETTEITVTFPSRDMSEAA